MAGLDVAFSQINDMSERVARHAERAEKNHEDHEMRIRRLEESATSSRIYWTVALGVLSVTGSFLGGLALRLFKGG